MRREAGGTSGNELHFRYRSRRQFFPFFFLRSAEITAFRPVQVCGWGVGYLRRFDAQVRVKRSFAGSTQKYASDADLRVRRSVIFTALFAASIVPAQSTATVERAVAFHSWWNCSSIFSFRLLLSSSIRLLLKNGEKGGKKWRRPLGKWRRKDSPLRTPSAADMGLSFRH